MVLFKFLFVNAFIALSVHRVIMMLLAEGSVDLYGQQVWSVIMTLTAQCG